MYKQAWEKINNAHYIVIVSHVYPDGDTLGSSLGLFQALKSIGKKAVLFNATTVELPKEFSFLDSFEKINSKLPKRFDLLITCDCPSFDKTGIECEGVDIINIDHHGTNTLFGDINLVEANFSSTGLVVHKLLTHNECQINFLCAEALYTSIADDTGFFRYGNLDAQCFKIVSSLVEYGVNPGKISNHINSHVSLAKIRLRAYMLNNFDLHVNGTIASIIFEEQILKQCGVRRSDTKNIVSELRDLATVELAIMIMEQKGFIKVSLRSSGKIDVSSIAEEFGGGGHKSAAGFDVEIQDMNELLEKLIKISKQTTQEGNR